MSILDKVSKKIGLQNWQYNIFHDDGNRESDGGGKSCAYLSPPGKGKSTLMVQAEQSVRCVLGDSKKGYVAHMNAGKSLDGYDVEPETVIHRIREFDNFNVLFPENWMRSNPNWNVSCKPVHIFVHEKDNPVFYCYKNDAVCAPLNMPPIERYSNAKELISKIHWNHINAVLEPQTYRLSENLIFALKKHKMDDDDSQIPEGENDDDEELPEVALSPHPPAVKKTKRYGKPQGDRKKKPSVNYARKFVDPAYFWYDMFDMAYRSNNRRHITFFIDEFHDVAEADCEGDAWKLISILATKTYPQFRKNNVSLHLSTHQLSFIDYRIVKRIEYINWFRGAKISPGNSMIERQQLLSQLEMGQVITEERDIQFGVMTFDKNHNAPPQVYVEGLMGQNRALTDKQTEQLLQKQENLIAPDYFKVRIPTLPDVIEV